MDITHRLRGKRVAAVMTNGHTLLIQADDGAELVIAWADHNGRPIKGKPVVSQSGVRLAARGAHELAYHPSLRTKGQA